MSSNTHFPTNPFAAQQRLLRERLYFLLADLHPLLKVDVMRALEERGKLLSQPHTDANSEAILPAGAWSMLTLLVAQYIASDIDIVYATSVAIAVECFICALDLLDDIEDEDQTPVVRALGMARTLNVSTTLLMMAQRAILSLLQQGIAPLRLLFLLDALQASALIATAGQHRDLLAEQRVAQDLSYEECVEIAAAKAGSLMRLACQIGTLCADAPNTLCEQFAELGELLGIAGCMKKM